MSTGAGCGVVSGAHVRDALVSSFAQRTPDRRAGTGGCISFACMTTSQKRPDRIQYVHILRLPIHSLTMSRADRRELINYLHALPVFGGLDDALLAKLAQAATWREYAPGAVIFLEEEPAQGLYYLQHGWLKIVKFSLDGREQILEFLGPGEIFNFPGVFAVTANPATAIALEAAGIWLLPRVEARRVLAASPDALLLVVESMMQRIATLVQMVTDLSLHSVESRLARRLLENAEQNVVYRRRWSTQAEMAAHLGTVPDVLNRALRSLAEAGLIRVERQQITILDPDGLAAKARLAG